MFQHACLFLWKESIENNFIESDSFLKFGYFTDSAVKAEILVFEECFFCHSRVNLVLLNGFAAAVEVVLLKHDLKAVLGHPLRAVGRGQDPSLVDERAAAEVVVLVRVSERGLQAGNPGELVRGGVVSADYVWPNLSSIFRVVAKVKPTSAAYAFQDVCQVLVWFSHVGWFFSFRRWFVGIVHIGVEVNGRRGQGDTAD